MPSDPDVCRRPPAKKMCSSKPVQGSPLYSHHFQIFLLANVPVTTWVDFLLAVHINRMINHDLPSVNHSSNQQIELEKIDPCPASEIAAKWSGTLPNTLTLCLYYFVSAWKYLIVSLSLLFLVKEDRYAFIQIFFNLLT